MSKNNNNFIEKHKKKLNKYISFQFYLVCISVFIIYFAANRQTSVVGVLIFLGVIVLMLKNKLKSELIEVKEQ